MKYNNLSSLQLDVLREIGNIGAGNAATSLSQLIDKPIEMRVPSVKVVSYDDMMELIGGPDEIVVAILFRVYGDLSSTVIFILNVEEAETLVQSIINEPNFSFKEGATSNQMALSALEEVGNIVTGSYISALADFTKINLQPSVPHLGIDMAGAVLTYGLIELSQVSDYAIIIDTKINSNETKNQIEGNFFLLPDPDSLDALFRVLGISENE